MPITLHQSLDEGAHISSIHANRISCLESTDHVCFHLASLTSISRLIRVAHIRLRYTQVNTPANSNLYQDGGFKPTSVWQEAKTNSGCNLTGAIWHWTALIASDQKWICRDGNSGKNSPPTISSFCSS